MTIRLIAGYLLAFAIGVTCRLVSIPLPAPTAMLGAIIVLAITLGYLSADRLYDQQQKPPKA
jgi:XapX domain-containing protein